MENPIAVMISVISMRIRRKDAVDVLLKKSGWYEVEIQVVTKSSIFATV